MKRWAAIAAMLLALLGVSIAPAYADPTNTPNPFTFEITCGNTTYTVVGVPGQGQWTPALVTDSNQVLIPTSFDITFTDLTTGQTDSFAVSKEAGNHLPTQSCCSAIYFVHPDGTMGEHRASGPTGSQSFDLPKGSIVAGCRLQLERRPAAVVQKALQHRLKVWKETQPFALATAGYVWKNPPGDRAARLVETVGLRGKRLNGAEISSKAANLIVNRGGATHHDVLALMEMVRERVETRLGITLRPEIKLVGFPAGVPFEAQPLELSAAR